MFCRSEQDEKCLVERGLVWRFGSTWGLQLRTIVTVIVPNKISVGVLLLTGRILQLGGEGDAGAIQCRAVTGQADLRFTWRELHTPCKRMDEKMSMWQSEVWRRLTSSVQESFWFGVEWWVEVVIPGVGVWIPARDRRDGVRKLLVYGMFMRKHFTNGCGEIQNF